MASEQISVLIPNPNVPPPIPIPADVPDVPIDFEKIIAGLEHQNLLADFAKFALKEYSEDDLENVANSCNDIFNRVITMREGGVKIIYSIAEDMAAGKGRGSTEKAMFMCAARCIVIARLLKTGKGTVTYETVLDNFMEQARQCIGPEVLHGRIIANIGETEKQFSQDCDRTVQLCGKALIPKGDHDAACAGCYLVALGALTLLWDLRVFWAFGGVPGLMKRIKELKKNLKREARENAESSGV
jgi:hypothetical protein